MVCLKRDCSSWKWSRYFTLASSRLAQLLSCSILRMALKRPRCSSSIWGGFHSECFVPPVGLGDGEDCHGCCRAQDPQYKTSPHGGGQLLLIGFSRCDTLITNNWRFLEIKRLKYPGIRPVRDIFGVQNQRFILQQIDPFPITYATDVRHTRFAGQILDQCAFIVCTTSLFLDPHLCSKLIFHPLHLVSLPFNIDQNWKTLDHTFHKTFTALYCPPDLPTLLRKE